MIRLRFRDPDRILLEFTTKGGNRERPVNGYKPEGGKKEGEKRGKAKGEKSCVEV